MVESYGIKIPGSLKMVLCCHPVSESWQNGHRASSGCALLYCHFCQDSDTDNSKNEGCKNGVIWTSYLVILCML